MQQRGAVSGSAAARRVDELVAEAEERIRAAGFKLVYRDYVEDARTPGFPGHILGRTTRDDRTVVISTVAVPSRIALLRVLRHELGHVEHPDWDCGSRAVWDDRPTVARSWSPTSTSAVRYETPDLLTVWLGAGSAAA